MDNESFFKKNYMWILFVGIIPSSFVLGMFYQIFLVPIQQETNQTENNTNPINPPQEYDPDNNGSLVPPDSNTSLIRWGEIDISGVGTFKYHPDNVTSIRTDIFQPNHFSVFDILVFLDNTSQIELEYYYNISMNTNVIISINNDSGENNDAMWHYKAWYDGGWRERNVFRMDHFPVKDKMTIRILKESNTRMRAIHSAWIREIERKVNNSDQVIIPEVIIQGPPNEGTLRFYNVNVSAHNLRIDIFRLGTITAIDVVLSLADQYDNFSVGLQWYESIGSAGVVKNYWVERINSWSAYDTCGFVYEAGDLDFQYFTGNHIHLPSDTRVINSPEYVMFFWICL